MLDYKDIYKQALEDNIQTPAELPYFEGDFWPNVMEDNIRELEEEEEARRRVSFELFLKWKLKKYFPICRYYALLAEKKLKTYLI